jgi:3-oxoacyl-[acyl-carrier-protein] synthase II
VNRRVVVTGMGGLCAVGQDWKSVAESLRAGRSGVQRVPDWAEIDGLKTELGAPITDFVTPEGYPRKKTRSMGRVALLSARACELALSQAGLLGDDVLGSGRAGTSYGSTSGSPPAMEVYARQFMNERTTKGITANEYVRFMSHTCAANVAQFFGIRGRIVPTCSACTSGSQGIGYGYEAIRFGRQDVMVTGGAEEFHQIDAAVFDILYATSTRNDDPSSTPRPFDTNRDGLVVGEGAGALVLEELDRARARGAHILAEVVGYGTNCDGAHITNPDAGSMERVMRLALEDAGCDAGDVDYVNAHGTATEVGDVAESQATHAVFGGGVPVSTLKSYMGHTLGACGALEAWMSIEMMREGWLAPTLNLTEVDPRCAPLDYVMGSPRELEMTTVMSNNFAFGGVNTSLLFRRFDEGA